MTKNAIKIFAAPAALALMLAFSGAAQAKQNQAAANGTKCRAATTACFNKCNRVFVQIDRINACKDRCMATEKTCLANPSPGKIDTGGTPNPKTTHEVKPTGGVLSDPKTPPKGTGVHAPLTGGVFHQSTSGTGSGGTILRSGNDGGNNRRH
jgi:hypothetical protein